MKTRFLLSIMLMMFGSNYINAQSHISTGKYACQLVPKSRGYEKYTCPACAANDLKEKQAKAAEDKRRSDAAIAKANADKAARDLAYKKEQKERDEKNKVTEVGLAMPSDESLTKSTSNTENTNSNSISETPVYTPTYTKQDVTNQVINQAATLAGGLINDWNANYDKKMETWKAESESNTNAYLLTVEKKKQSKFVSEFLPLLKQAINGDKNARMLLYYTSGELDSKEYVPQRLEWFLEAFRDNNIDAILTSVTLKKFNSSSPFMETEFISTLEKASRLGSLDAMLALGVWYNSKSHTTYGIKFTGGDNAQKAIEWFNKGAQSGCPSAMYHLAMIYKYGVTYTSEGNSKKGNIIYSKDLINENLAFEWFSKSLLHTNFKQSLFSRSLQTLISISKFNVQSYYELSKIYQKGKVVQKDDRKAKELLVEAEKYKELKENENFWNY